MNGKKPFHSKRPNLQSGFSMLEMLMVIGIIGVLIGVGSVAYMNQISSARVSSGVQILNANFRIARQQSIAMRQRRRVCIHAGHLSGMDTESGQPTLSGTRESTEEPFFGRVAVWVEGKRSQEYYFSDNAYNIDRNLANAYETTEVEYFPDGIMIADLDGNIPGIDSPKTFYIEFNSRGAISKVYFEGGEKTTTSNSIAPIIHIARDGEVFSVDGTSMDYTRAISSLDSSKLQAGGDYAKERFKIQTIELIRLTGKSRVYDFAIFNPWPIDELIERE
jgi:prepilin-type N-terminal cleavage/methylation domain-containing protein